VQSRLQELAAAEDNSSSASSSAASAASASSASGGWGRGRREEPFITRSTMADPWRLDGSLAPNGRAPLSLQALAQENHSPAGLARFCTLR
jgi:hypothetical protein